MPKNQRCIFDGKDPPGDGAETWWEDQDLYLDCSHAEGTVIPEYYSGKMRSSVILLGAMLGRNGKRHRQDIPEDV